MTDVPRRRRLQHPWLRLGAVGLACAAMGACTPVATGELRFDGPPPVTIPGLDACRPGSPNLVDLDPSRRLVVFVHGCNASGGRFLDLSRHFQERGLQTICFNYNDRDHMVLSARRLRSALEALFTHLEYNGVTVVGHSQGGLIARRALVREGRPRAFEPRDFNITLITISSPFHGIEASRHCGLLALHILSLGISAAICQAVTGDKWDEVHPGSEFMERPGTLISEVSGHLKIATDERDACLERGGNGACRVSDHVFSMDEQRHPAVDRDPRVVDYVLAAGHSAVVGQDGSQPDALLQVLDEHGCFDE